MNRQQLGAGKREISQGVLGMASKINELKEQIERCNEMIREEEDDWDTLLEC